MASKTTVALTKEQYIEIIETMRTGGAGFRPNEKIATALVLEANLGLRIGDILNLKLNSIKKDGNRYRLDIVEQKTKKTRRFTVPAKIYKFIVEYCEKYNIAKNEKLFAFSERNVQLYLQKVTDYLDFQDIGTHSFRKFFATEILINNDYNLALVQQLLQHSSIAVTQRYIGFSSKQIEKALNEHIILV